MAKVTLTPSRPQTGDYGRARAHEPVKVEEKLAEKLLKTGIWTKGVSPIAEARAAAVAARREEEAESKKKSPATNKTAVAKPDGGAQ